MNNFWEKLKKPFGSAQGRPILALAPMAGITDAAFRYLCGKYGADVVYSEMISAAGLFYDSKRTSGLLDVYRKNGGAKFVVQLFGNNPEHFIKAVKIIEKKIKPDGIDINFGCPVMKIIKSCSGAKLFQDLNQSRRVIEAVLANTKLPVSVKIRAHAGKISALEFIDKMKDLPIAAIMVHGRTLAQGFAGPVDYGIINRVKKKFKGIVLANGGINNLEDAEIMLKKTGADGIGIGQGACGRPQIFAQIKNVFRKSERNTPQLRSEAELRWARPASRGASHLRLGEALARRASLEGNIFKIALEHAKLMEKFKGRRGILEMRKHLCWYVKGMPGAAEMRQEFVKVETLADIKKLLK
ncbi:MAG: tRNA-dihydrouridine synthase [Patescibacteria group bacterium]|nr:tRNA-dihydrouridine synthase [Patescibacteria group bacterium]